MNTGNEFSTGSETAPRSRPGAMTTAMQAAYVGLATAPRVLRIGVLVEGRIVEERVLKSRGTVRIGSAESNAFVVAATNIPAKFELFQVVGSDYLLSFTAAMNGRVSLPAGVRTLDELRSSGAARDAGTHFQVKLTDASRGKVSIGETTFLFQFVPQPTAQVRPQLPAAARGGFVKSIDWTYSAFIMFSFMVHFGFVIYLESADWETGSDLSQVPHEVARMIFAEPEAPDVAEIEPDQIADADAPTPDRAPLVERRTAPTAPSRETHHDTAPRESASDQTARLTEQAAAQAEQLLVGALGNAVDSAIADVLAGGAITGGAIPVLENATGVGTATSAAGSMLRTRDGGGRDSGEGRDIGSIVAAARDAATAQQHEGDAVQEHRVHARIEVEDGEITGGCEFEVTRVVAMIRNRMGVIRGCYERELRRDPTLAGKIAVEFTIQTTGSVSGVHTTENTTHSEPVGACVVSTVSRFRFNPAPTDGSVTFEFPFVFAPQI